MTFNFSVFSILTSSEDEVDEDSCTNTVLSCGMLFTVSGGDACNGWWFLSFTYLVEGHKSYFEKNTDIIRGAMVWWQQDNDLHWGNLQEGIWGCQQHARQQSLWLAVELTKANSTRTKQIFITSVPCWLGTKLYLLWLARDKKGQPMIYCHNRSLSPNNSHSHNNY